MSFHEYRYECTCAFTACHPLIHTYSSSIARTEAARCDYLVAPSGHWTVHTFAAIGRCPTWPAAVMSLLNRKKTTDTSGASYLPIPAYVICSPCHRRRDILTGFRPSFRSSCSIIGVDGFRKGWPYCLGGWVLLPPHSHMAYQTSQQNEKARCFPDCD